MTLPRGVGSPLGWVPTLLRGVATSPGEVTPPLGEAAPRTGRVAALPGPAAPVPGDDATPPVRAARPPSEPTTLPRGVPPLPDRSPISARAPVEDFLHGHDGTKWAGKRCFRGKSLPILSRL